MLRESFIEKENRPPWRTGNAILRSGAGIRTGDASLRQQRILLIVPQ